MIPMRREQNEQADEKQRSTLVDSSGGLPPKTAQTSIGTCLQVQAPPKSALRTRRVTVSMFDVASPFTLLTWLYFVHVLKSIKYLQYLGPSSLPTWLSKVQEILALGVQSFAISTRAGMNKTQRGLTRDRTADPNSRDKTLRRERVQGKLHFLLSADLLKMMTTLIHTHTSHAWE